MRSLALIALLLAGCGTTKTVEKIVEVKVPVKVGCVKDAPARPEYRFTGKATTDAEASSQVKALYLDWLKADEYGRKLEVATAGCLPVEKEEAR
jgi:hypothetical protein